MSDYDNVTWLTVFRKDDCCYARDADR